MSVELTDEQYLDLLIQARGASKQGATPRVSRLRRLGQMVGNAIIFILIALVALVFAFVARVQYGLPVPLPESLVRTAVTTFSTAAAPLPTAARVQQQPAGAPAFPLGGAAPWPTLTPEPEEPTATAAPIAPSVPTPNLAPSGVESNPGFTCGVEPGATDPNADCQDTRPDAVEAGSASIPKQGPRHVGERGSDKAGPGEGGE